MRRRRPDTAGMMPAHLAVFDAREWPAEDFRGAFKLWQSARRLWAEEHGGEPNPLELIQHEADVRATLTGGFLHSWGRTGPEMAADAERMHAIYRRRPKVSRYWLADRAP